MDGIVGGICGFYRSSDLSNCYSVGKIIVEGESSRIGNIIGSNDGSVISCYYLKDNIQTLSTPNSIGTAMDDSAMKGTELIELLNEDNENIWKQDTNNINNGYPIFSWQN